MAFCLCNCLFISRFVRKWEVQERSYAGEWGVDSIEEDYNRVRPEFRGHVKLSLITHRPEAYYSSYRRVSIQPVYLKIAIHLAH